MEQDPYELLGGAKGRPVKMWTRGVPVEPEAKEQLSKLAQLPFVFHHVAVMPDVHVGKGSTIGSVIPTLGAVIPAAVGVDIGCGMMAAKTTLRAGDLPDNLGKLRSAIEQAIPHGMSPKTRNAKGRDAGSWNNPPPAAEAGWMKLKDEFDEICRKYPKLRGTNNYKHLGTLGSGNHFVEICLDEDQFVWLMLHSGSRNIGKELAEFHIGVAQKLPHNQGLVDRDLAVFIADTPQMAAYRNDLFWAQEYAKYNRTIMMALFKDVVRKEFKKAKPVFEPEISAHHNYVAEERYDGMDLLVTRKGAIRAGSGDYGIIPGSMGTGSYIVKGLGNPLSFNSASHGAGRRMSRTAAKKRFSTKDLEEQTRGVECRKDSGVVDEIPGAYKPIEQVIDQQRDLVQVVAKLKQVVCVKG